MKIEEPLIRRAGSDLILEITVDGRLFTLANVPLLEEEDTDDALAKLSEYIITDLAHCSLNAKKKAICNNIKYYKRGPEFPKKYVKVLVEHFHFDIIKMQKAFDYMGSREFVESFISYDSNDIIMFKEAFDFYIHRAGCEYLSGEFKNQTSNNYFRT
jgi:hypothetical protein